MMKPKGKQATDSESCKTPNTVPNVDEVSVSSSTVLSSRASKENPKKNQPNIVTKADSGSSSLSVCINNDTTKVLRCSTCMTVYHSSCIGEEATHIENWNCHECRRIPHYLSKILSYVEKSQEVIDDMATKLHLLEHKLDQTNSEIKSQRHEMKTWPNKCYHKQPLLILLGMRIKSFKMI